MEKTSRGVRLSHWQTYREKKKKVNFTFTKQVTAVDISSTLLQQQPLHPPSKGLGETSVGGMQVTELLVLNATALHSW